MRYTLRGLATNTDMGLNVVGIIFTLILEKNFTFGKVPGERANIKKRSMRGQTAAELGDVAGGETSENCFLYVHYME